MFNNVVLDVFIGLVLVYLLYSLFITIVSEMITTWICLRSRILRISIEKMLNDGYYRSLKKRRYFSAWYHVQRFFLKEFPDFKYSFAGRFYNSPTIAYLSNKAGEQTTQLSQKKPSYISADIFADTLIQLLKDRGDGATDMDRVNFSLRYNTHHIQYSTLKNLRDMALASGIDVNAFKEKIKAWYNETQDRATGWYKRKLRLILFWLGFIVAMIFNVDSIKIARLLAKDKDARDKLVAMSMEIVKDSARYQNFTSGNRDSALSQAILDSSFSRIQKDIAEAGMVLGLSWGTDKFLKPETYAVDSKSDKVFFEKLQPLVDSFNQLKTASRGGFYKIEQDIANIDSVTQQLEDRLLDSLYYKDSAQRLNSIKAQIISIRNTIAILAAAKNSDAHYLTITNKRISRINRIIDTATGSGLAIVDSITLVPAEDGNKLVIAGKRKWEWYEKTWYIITNAFNPKNFVGLFITGLMLSLGAPFWFDLLKKLVAIRGSGVKPEEKAPEDPLEVAKQNVQANSNVFNTTDPVEIALSLYRPYLETVPGVLAVNYDYITNGTVKTPCIEVSVAKGCCDKKLIPASYTVKVQGKDITVPVVIEDADLADLHMAVIPKVPELGVQNKLFMSTQNELGTVAGVVLNTRTGKNAILSCSHVLGGNNVGNALTGETAIINNVKKIIATLTFNMQSSSLDIAYADTLKDIPVSYRLIDDFAEVKKSDGEMETDVFMYGCISGKQTGAIINHKTHFPFRVNGSPFVMVNLIKITRRNGNQRSAISVHGDSGALITRAKDDMPIGVVVGGTKEFTYAMSLNSIFNSLFIKPVKNQTT